jgi:peptidoglycan/xylan/chitin deacetylase (PgdA/CDA1 family)
MSAPQRPPYPGPARDFVGYGPTPPDFDWPGGARIAINLVVNYEEGGEYSLNEDGVNDTWGEYSFHYGPDIRDIGPDAVGMGRDQEREEIRKAVDSLQRTTGERVRGWMVRSFPTVHTRELLVEDGGFWYDSDAGNDELPYYAATLGRPFLVVPYSKVHNDVRYLIAPTYASPRHFF